MSGIQLAASNSPVDVAWLAFDRAALRMHRLYANASSVPDTPEERERRMQAGQEVVRLWDEWRTLYLRDGDEPRPAA